MSDSGIVAGVGELERPEQGQSEQAQPEQVQPEQEESGQAQSEQTQPEQTQSEEEEEIEVPQKPIISVICATDGLSAEVEFRRVATETLNPTEEDIRAELLAKGVTTGIDDNLLKHLCSRPVYGEPVEIAKGKRAVIGKDGYLVYLIKTTKDLRPKEQPNGRVDYFDLGYTQNVEKGQPLCEVNRPEKGEDGFNIYGAVLEGIYGREVNIPTGRNTEFDKTRGIVIATCDGSVEVSYNGTIEVQDVLRIKGNVDNSTGNIYFIGDVIINGDVASGFKIDAKGSIVVKGTVEGATLNAGSDITIGGGINGMNRAKFSTPGSLKCKYIQNCSIVAGGDIFADTIMYSTIECSGSIELSGKSGVLIGGKTVVAKALTAKGLGTSAHASTHITMAAVGLQHNQKITAMKKKISDLDTELVLLIQTMTWCQSLLLKGPLKPFQEKAYENAKVRQVEILEERPALIKELEEAQNELLNVSSKDSYIKCTGTIHTGVKIVFGAFAMTVQQSFVNSRIYMNEGEIITSSL